MGDLFITSFQVAIFPKDFGIANIKEISRRLLALKQYEGAPLIVPLDDSDNLLPLIALKTEDGSKLLQVSSEKIHFFWNDEKGELKTTEDEIVKNVKEVLESIEIRKVKRIGFITEIHRLVDSEKNENISLLRDHILNSSLTEKLTNYQIRLTFETFFSCYGKGKTNQVIDLVNAKRKIEPHDSIIVLRNDLNTHQDEDADLNVDEVLSFIKEAKGRSLPEDIWKTLWSHSETTT